MFDFITASSDIDKFSLDGAILEQMSIEQSDEVAKFDFSMGFAYNPTSDDNLLSCSLICSRDIFDKTTVTHISQRFEHLFDQIFGSSLSDKPLNGCMISIKKFSVILPEEAGEMEAITFCRLDNTVKEGMCLIID
jgi:hypothetical protein